MVGQYGIKETLEVIGFGLTVGTAFGASLADDGKINFADFPKFSPVFPFASPAITDIALVPKEIADLQESELEEIRVFVLANGAGIPGINEKWLKVASGALKMGLGLLEVLEAFKKA